MVKDVNSIPSSVAISTVLICIAVTDALAKQGLIDSCVKLSTVGKERIGDVGSAKFMSEGFFKRCLRGMELGDEKTCADIARLARAKNLIADLDEGVDQGWIQKTLAEHEKEING